MNSVTNKIPNILIPYNMIKFFRLTQIYNIIGDIVTVIGGNHKITT
jgi:hypothetical protein